MIIMEKEELSNNKINLNTATIFFESANIQTNTQNTVPIKKQWRNILSQKTKELEKDNTNDQISK